MGALRAVCWEVVEGLIVSLFFSSPHSMSPPRSLSSRMIRVLESLLGVGGVGGRYQPRLLMEVTREP